MTENSCVKSGHLSEIVINPSPTCNLACRYCYDKWRNKTSCFTTDDTLICIKGMVESLGLDHINISFIGGEALCAGIEYFKHFEEMFKEISHKCYIQSNMTLLNDEFCDFFKLHDYTIGGSFDGIPEVHDYNRGGSFSKTLEGIAIAKEYGIYTLTTCTITERSAEHAEEIFELFALMNTPIRFNAGTPQTSPEKYKSTIQKMTEMWFDFSCPFEWKKMQDTCAALLDGKWDDITHPGCSACMAGSINIEYDGQVNTCAACAHDPDFIIGNMLKNAPLEIVNHPNRFAFFKRTIDIRKRCRSCEFRYICMGTCYANAHSWRLDHDPYCGGGVGTYKAVLNRLDISLDDYKEMIKRLV